MRHDPIYSKVPLTTSRRGLQISGNYDTGIYLIFLFFYLISNFAFFYFYFLFFGFHILIIFGFIISFFLLLSQDWSIRGTA